jgi:hypothetical protein
MTSFPTQPPTGLPVDATTAPDQPDLEPPQYRHITSRAELRESLQLLLDRATSQVRIAAIDLSVFDLGSADAVSSLRRLLTSSRFARVHLLADDMHWLDTGAPRLRALQRDYPHALLIRCADFHDRIGDDSFAIGDHRDALRLQATRGTLGELWSNNGPFLRELLSGFERRWDRATHDQAAKPLGL